MPSTAVLYSSIVGVLPNIAERTTTGVDASNDSHFFCFQREDRQRDGRGEHELHRAVIQRLRAVRPHVRAVREV